MTTLRPSSWWARQLRRALSLLREPRRGWGLAGKAWRHLRREGWASTWRRARRKLKPPLPPAEAEGAWLRAHQTLAEAVAAHGPRPFVLFLSPIDWGWMPQRPQGLAMACAEAGWCVGFTTPQLRGDEVDHWRELASRLFLLADPGLVADRPGLLVWAMHPQAWREWPRFRAAWLVFDLLDLPELTAGEGPWALAAWSALLAQASVGVASARALVALAQGLGRSEVCALPNGVAPGRWAQARPTPEALGPGAGPVALYPGAIAAWLDFELIAAVAQALPGWRFVFVGPDFDGSAARLPALPNLRWLGLKPGEALPGLYAAATLMWIPFRLGPLTEATSPVKAFEAWAAGLPVVASPLPELAGAPGAWLAEGPAAHLAAFEAAAATRWSPVDQGRRQGEAEAASWSRRLEALGPALAARGEARRRKPHLVILSGVPLDDSGGGQRPAMLARAFLALGWRVGHAHRFPKAEGVELGLMPAHPWLEQQAWAELAPEAWAPEASGPWPPGWVPDPEPAAVEVAMALGAGPEALEGDWRPEAWMARAQGHPGPPPALLPPELAPPGARWVLLAYPHPDALPWLRRWKALGYRVVVDLIDAWWAPGLGADWWSEAAWLGLLAEADLAVASAEALARRLAKDAPHLPCLRLPNAVRAACFDPGRGWPRPEDWPEGPGPALLYVGALWGAWVDQGLLRELAEAWPEARVVLIGEGPPPEGREPPNLHRLGLKAQDALPAYLAQADLGLIPFRPGALTEAVSPLKVYEYLAMGLPVVSTPMPELEGLPGLRQAMPGEAFVAACREVLAEGTRPELGTEWRTQQGWGARAEALIRFVQAHGGGA